MVSLNIIGQLKILRATITFMGIGMIVEVVFGKIFINFGLKLLAVSIGAILYYLVIQVVLWMGLNTNDLKLLTALVVGVFLAIPYWKGKYVSVKKPERRKGNA